MNALSYILILAAVFIGLVFGYWISRMAKDELKPGRIYLAFAQTMAAVIVMMASINLFKVSAAIIIIAGLLLFMISIFTRIAKILNSYIFYPIMGLFIYCAYATGDQGVLLIMAISCFIYGLITSMLMASSKMKLAKIMLYNSGFFITGIFPLLFPSLLRLF